jgi:hypothetical protein
MGQGLLYIKHKRLFAFKWCKVDMRLTRGSLNLPFEKVHSNIKNKKTFKCFTLRIHTQESKSNT